MSSIQQKVLGPVGEMDAPRTIPQPSEMGHSNGQRIRSFLSVTSCFLFCFTGLANAQHNFTLIHGNADVEGHVNGAVADWYDIATSSQVPASISDFAGPNAQAADWSWANAGFTHGRSYAISECSSTLGGNSRAVSASSEETRKTNFNVGPATVWFYAAVVAPNTNIGVYDDTGSLSKSRADVGVDTWEFTLWHHKLNTPRWKVIARKNGTIIGLWNFPNVNNVNAFLVRGWSTAAIAGGAQFSTESNGTIANFAPQNAKITADVAVQ